MHLAYLLSCTKPSTYFFCSRN